MKYSLLRFLYAFCFLVGFFSCSDEKMDLQKLNQYIADPDNKLSQTKELSDIDMTLIYRPSSIVALQELKINGVCDSLFPQKVQKYAPYLYFVLTLKTRDGRDPVYHAGGGHSQFSERLQKLAFRTGEFIYAKIGNDTIPLTDFYFPNHYGMGGSSQVLLSFIKPQIKDQDIEVIIGELGFGVGRQKFVFSHQDLINVPDLGCSQ